VVWGTRPYFSKPSQPHFGKSRASATTHRSEKTASTVEAKFVRQTILGGRSSMLVRMDASSHRRHAGNGRPLAPGWFSFVLEDDLQSQEASWEKTNLEGGSGVDLPDGRRESDVGSAAHPWGASHVGF
jgi:hypothetical protein